MIFIAGLLLASCGGNSKTTTNTSTSPSQNSSAAGQQTVTIASPDGVQLIGTFWTSPRPSAPALLLLHQWQSDRHSFDDFAKLMNDDGFGVLSIDGRGFGESTKRADGSSVSAERTDDAVNAMLGDVAAAVEFLKHQQNVDPERIGIVGASYGSSLAIIHAADHADIKAVALLSPGLNYFGNMPSIPAIRKYGDRPLYLLSGQRQDEESFDAVDQMNRLCPKCESTVHPDGGHGTALLKVGAKEELRDFFDRKLAVIE